MQLLISNDAKKIYKFMEVPIIQRAIKLNQPLKHTKCSAFFQK